MENGRGGRTDRVAKLETLDFRPRDAPAFAGQQHREDEQKVKQELEQLLQDKEAVGHLACGLRITCAIRISNPRMGGRRRRPRRAPVSSTVCQFK